MMDVYRRKRHCRMSQITNYYWKQDEGDINPERKLGIETAVFASLNPLYISRPTQVIGLVLRCRLAQTAKGYLALVPAAAATGDRVVFPASAGSAYIILPSRRHVSRDSSLWEMVSWSYIPGMMEGELWTESRLVDMLFL